MSAETESQVIGAVLADERAFDRVGPLLEPAMFQVPVLRKAWATVRLLAESGASVDVLSVTDCAERRFPGNPPVTLPLLSDLAANSFGDVTSHAQRLRTFALDRALRQAGEEMLELAKQPGSREERLGAAQQALEELSGDSEGDYGPVKASEYLGSVFEALQARQDVEGVPGLSTGLASLDAMTTGLHGGELVLLAARPSIGKTAFALHMARHAAAANRTVLVFSLEMSGPQLAERILSASSGVGYDRMRHGNLGPGDWSALSDSLTRIHGHPVYIDDHAGISPASLLLKARQVKRRHGLGLVIVDYLQLLSLDRRIDSRAQELAEISRGLKLLAKELDVPVLALSQLNRQVEQRTDKRPRLSDLRESGALEQDADIVMLMYRDEVYDELSPLAGYAELALAKQRNGPLGTAWSRFDGRLQRFEHCEKPEITPRAPKRKAASGYCAPRHWTDDEQ